MPSSRPIRVIIPRIAGIPRIALLVALVVAALVALPRAASAAARYERLRKARRGTLTLRVRATDEDENIERLKRTIQLQR